MFCYTFASVHSKGVTPHSCQVRRNDGRCWRGSEALGRTNIGSLRRRAQREQHKRQRDSMKKGPYLLHIIIPHFESLSRIFISAVLTVGYETLISAVQEIMHERNDGYEPHAMRPRDKLWTLNGATIRSVNAMIRRRKFQNVRIELAPLFSTMNEKWARWKMRYYAPFFRPLRHVAFLNELFVHRIVLEITK